MINWIYLDNLYENQERDQTAFMGQYGLYNVPELLDFISEMINHGILAKVNHFILEDLIAGSESEI